MSLLNRFPAFETRSVAAARADLTLFDEVAEFDAEGEATDFRMRINAVRLGDVRIAAVATTGHRVGLHDEVNATMLLPWRGSLATDDGVREHRARGDGFALPRPGRRRTMVLPGYVGIVAQLPIATLRGIAARNPEDQALARWPSPEHAFLPTGGALARYLRHLVTELHGADALVRSERSALSAAVLFTDLLLDHFRSAADQRGPAAAGLAYVRQAEAAIRAHFHEPLSMAEVAGELGIGTRALQLAFQHHRGVSPRAFLALCRLDEARRRLMHPRPTDTVTDIAFACGISHLGRFSEEYRKRFGEAPSDTLAQGRRNG